MSGGTVAIYLDHWRDLEAAPPRLAQPRALWRMAIRFKANPRSAEYMRARLAERFPGAAFVEADARRGWEDGLAAADRVVLLYPDAIGLGFAPVERRVMAKVSRDKISVLNGRRRTFALDRRTRARLALRRALERTMLVECVVGGLMLLATPFLFAADYARGRR